MQAGTAGRTARDRPGAMPYRTGQQTGWPGATIPATLPMLVREGFSQVAAVNTRKEAAGKGPLNRLG